LMNGVCKFIILFL